MRATCIIILNILHTTHNSVHIAHIIIPLTHNIVHIIHLYAMRPMNHGLDIMTSKKIRAQHMEPQLESLP